MLEQQFVTFAAIIDQQDRRPILPVVAGETGLEFYTPDALTDAGNFGVRLAIVTPSDNYTIASVTGTRTDNHVTIFAETGGDFTASHILGLMAPGTPFRVKYSYADTDGAQHVAYSQIMMLRDNTDGALKLLRYRCTTTTGGIPYLTGQYVSVWMPIWLDGEQFKQDSEEYVKLDGSVAVLYATKTKEYEAETDYMPLEMHEKMVTALMSDEVYIDGERLQKSEDYEIDWENVQTIHNRIKHAKATWKMKACTLVRNTNS